MPSFKEDLIALTEAFGPHNASLVVPLALVPWESGDHRDDFIRLIKGDNGGAQ